MAYDYTRTGWRLDEQGMPLQGRQRERVLARREAVERHAKRLLEQPAMIRFQLHSVGIRADFTHRLIVVEDALQTPPKELQCPAHPQDRNRRRRVA